MRAQSGKLLVPLLAFVVVAGVVVVILSTTAAHRPAAVPLSASGSRPNIVFVLTDDLSLNLLRFMPHVQAMERNGVTFRDYFVSDSLCCPSRASIFTGDFPHDTGVFNNVGADGGFNVFHRRGEERRTFAVALQRAGYRTAMMGKYLNGYLEKTARSVGVTNKYVPPGWSEWDVAGWGYPEFNYWLNENGGLHYYGHASQDYLTDVLARRGVRFIDRSAASGKPFFLELATFAPHEPYTPAPRDAHNFPRLRAPQPQNFDVLPTHPPDWLAGHPRLTPAQMTQIDSVFRRRAQSVQAVDDMIAQIEAALSAHGLANNTYLVFSSDNGYHTGEYRLMPGKLTAFNTDIRVPLVIDGPRVPVGRTSDAMVENIDLAKTFAAIAGTTMSADGHSLLSLLRGQKPSGWRKAILVEHRGPVTSADTPDFQEPASGNPDTYEALRTRDFLYVEYADRKNSVSREFYNLRSDPFELHNTAGTLTGRQRAQLHSELSAIKRCHRGTACWAAMGGTPGRS